MCFYIIYPVLYEFDTKIIDLCKECHALKYSTVTDVSLMYIP